MVPRNLKGTSRQAVREAMHPDYSNQNLSKQVRIVSQVPLWMWQLCKRGSGQILEPCRTSLKNNSNFLPNTRVSNTDMVDAQKL